MSSTWSSKDGFQPSNSVSNATADLLRFHSWKHLSIVDVPVDNSREAFDWLIEQNGHNEYNSSYGPTCDSHWFGPFTSYTKPQKHCYVTQKHCYVIRDQHSAALFRLFHG